MNKTYFRFIAKLISVLTLVSFVASCGFQLRGSYQVPYYLTDLCVQTQQDSLLAKTLRLRLSQAGVNLQADEASCSQLTVLHDKLQRRTLSLFPNGQVAEYELIYSVDYQVTVKDGNANKYALEIFRDYQDNPDVVLAKSREMKLILQEMRTEAADRIVRQLASIRN